MKHLFSKKGVPRYVLLVSEMLKRTKKDHLDFTLLSEAKQRLEHTANTLNQKKKIYNEKRDMVFELKKIRAMIHPDIEELASVSRKLIL